MDLLFNDLSLHRQFRDASSFCEAMGQIMRMRQIARKHQWDVFCNRSLAWCNPVDNVHIKQAISAHFDKDQIGGVMAWLDRGPHWDSPESQMHGGDEMLAVDGTPVTNHAVGEAAMRSILGDACGLASLQPSDWVHSPLAVVWHDRGPDLADRTVSVENWWSPDSLESALAGLERPIQAWSGLEERVRRLCEHLSFVDGCFNALETVPFSDSAARMALHLFDTLNLFVGEHDAGGARTAEGHRIYQEYFVGEKSRFSLSSETEKNEMADRLTFPLPNGEQKLCSWHGKISSGSPPLRFHFSGIEVAEGVHIVYVGPKLTRR